MNVLDIVSWLLVGVVVFNWHAAAILWYAHREHPRIMALTERAQTQVVLAVAATFFAVLALNRLVPLLLPADVVLVLLVTAVLLVSLPGVLWLVRYQRNEF